MTAADWTPPHVNGALPAIRCNGCGLLRNSHSPKAPCPMGCDDRAADDGPIHWEPTMLRGMRDVSLPEPAETCDVCGEDVNPEARCTHGRSLCPEDLDRCAECRAEAYDDRGVGSAIESWRDR